MIAEKKAKNAMYREIVSGWEQSCLYRWLIKVNGDGDAGSLKLPSITTERFRKYLLPPKPYLEGEPVETRTTLKTNPYPREAPFPAAV